MNWEQHAQNALRLLDCETTPSSEALISSIKAINPTSQLLPPAYKERAYELKNRLQNLLLENYGGCFSLVPHPVSPDIVLIKHLFLPSVDACHADLKKLSVKALDSVPTPEDATSAPLPQPKHTTPPPATGAPDTKGALTKAEQSLDKYDYCEAETILSGIRISDRNEIPALLKAARMLCDDMGLFDRAIELLLSQPRQFIKDKEVREVLACTYHGNGDLAEARVLFDSLRPEELGKEALFACADIAFKDGNPSCALHLLDLADRSVGFAVGIAPLRADIERALLAVAQPVVAKAVAALDGGDPATAATLAALALQHHPHYREAREVMARIEDIKRQDGLAALWQKLDKARAGGDRLRILGELRELDQKNSGKIMELIALEKERQKTELIEDRVGQLRRCLSEADWSGCFDILRSIAGNKALSDRLESAVALSPLFSVLYRNERLDRLSPHQAKKRWLEFMAVKESVAAGRRDGLFEVLQELKENFEGNRVFDSAYDDLLKEEQEKVRREIGRLLSGDDGGHADLARTFGRIRAMMTVLPASERAGYSSEMAELLELLKPAVSTKTPVGEYMDASILGLSERAARLRSKIDESLLAEIDAEVAELFRIEAKPLPLEFSKELPLDLDREEASVKVMGSNCRQILLREGEETLILIDLPTKSALRCQSILFRDLQLCDSLPDSNSFLFLDSKGGDLVVRATLSPAESCFKSFFSPLDTFVLHPDDYIIGAFMSGSNACEYYLFTKDIFDTRGAKYIKQCLDGNGRITKTRGEYISDARRLRFNPDGFLLGTSLGEAMLNQNLAYKHCITDEEVRVVATNTVDNQIYITKDVGVLAFDLEMKSPEILGEHLCNRMLYKPLGFAPHTGIALVQNHTGKGYFHRIQDGHHSQHFCLDKIIWTATPSTWYYCDYSSNSGTLQLRELRPETDDLFQWQDILACYQTTAGKSEG